jgi:allantoinase
MELDLIIQGAQVVTPDGVQSLDIGIAAGRIAELAPSIIATSKQYLSAKGMTIFPGVIDSHVHFNDPGRDHWEGIATGSAALAAGGGTCFIDMPLNSSPPTLDAASFAAKKAVALAKSHTDFALWGGLTPRNLDRLPELAECGVIGFKAFMSNSGIDDFLASDDLTLLRGMKIAAELKLPVAVHAESEAITNALTNAALAVGRTSARDYLDTRPVVSELEAIQRILLYARETGCQVHVVHISDRRGVELLRKYAATFNVYATCETCPHYLLLDENDVLQQGAVAKCAPPLRPRETTVELLAALNEGLIDTVGSDHSPAPAEMKTSADFFQIWGGISGVQITLRALLTLGVELPRIAQVLASNVAQRFQLAEQGTIAEQQLANLVLVDMSYEAALTRDELLDQHRLSPYLGRLFRGRIVRTLIRGQTVFADGKICSEYRGQLLTPRRATET